MQKQSKIILGIDPGMVVMGYGLVRCTGNQLHLLEMGVLRLPTREDNYIRLQLIQQKVQSLIVQFGPHEFAIEAPFFGKNVQSMLKLGRAQGVAIATAMHAGLTVTEYSPKKVKQSITGNGNSEKEQVWKMLQRILHLQDDIPAYDASDALAVAICHHFQDQTEKKLGKGGAETKKKVSRKKAGSWEDFIKKNPEKLR
ncbi:MAG: crossover junction endodeoxyribonuclease RuvC [Bacteroidetes bacterium]|nr:crossover junction endodeoxyribonuclease RuvC [Bacteroidota bacterium]